MSVVRRTPGAVWRNIPTGVLVRRPGEQADALVLSGTSADVWHELGRQPRRSDLDATVLDALIASGLTIETD